MFLRWWVKVQGTLMSISLLTIPASSFQLIQTNKLKHYPSIHGDFSSEFRQPCVVFTGHPSLRFGDVVHFMELWGKSSLNTIIFTGNCDFITSIEHGQQWTWMKRISLVVIKAKAMFLKAFVTFISCLQSRTFLTWTLWLPTSLWLWSVFTVLLTHGLTSTKYQSCSKRSRYSWHLLVMLPFIDLVNVLLALCYLPTTDISSK